MAEVKPEDESPPGIGDHPFDPRGEWWSLCKVCGLARAAHFSATPESIATMQAHFATLREKRDRQEAERKGLQYPSYESPREKAESGGLRIGYVSDDEDE